MYFQQVFLFLEKDAFFPAHLINGIWMDVNGYPTCRKEEWNQESITSTRGCP